jgi:hypothetical protein
MQGALRHPGFAQLGSEYRHAHGVAGQIVYTPAASFSGGDTLTYTIKDKQGREALAPATVTVTVTAAAASGGISGKSGGGGSMDPAMLTLLLLFLTGHLRRTFAEE